MEPFLLFLFTALGTNHLYIFMFKREWFDDKNIFLAIVVFYIILFLLATLLHYTGVYDRNESFLVLKMPLLSIALYKALQFAFVKLFGYKPKDSFWTYDVKLMKDGLFNFTFWVLGTLIPMVLIFGKFV